MSYSVICPSCKEKNAGNAFHCVKCNADLVGVPRQEDAPSFNDSAFQRRAGAESPAVSPVLPKPESFGHALWRSLRSSLVIFLIAALCTIVVCLLGNWTTYPDFGNGLIYAGVALSFIGWLTFSGSQRIARGQANGLNPGYRGIPGKPSERARQYWGEFMQGMDAAPVIGVAVALCIGIGWLIISVVH